VLSDSAKLGETDGLKDTLGLVEGDFEGERETLGL